MMKLIGNENMKIYRRKRTWIMMGFLVAALILAAILIFTHQHQTSSNWKHNLTVQNTQLEQTLSHNKKHMSSSAVSSLQAQIQMNNYDIAHNINPNQTTGWKFAAQAKNLSTLLIAFILVVAGDIVASEFSTGTIKMLLTQTATRTKVLAAKFTSMLLFGLFATAFMFVASYIIGGLFFGFTGADAPTFYTDAHQHIQHMPTVAYLLMQYGFMLVQLILMATIAFMISSIFRSSALAITISLLAFVVGRVLVQALLSYHWVKYILFTNSDLSQFVVNGPMVKGLTLGFSLTMVIAYFVVMNLLAWLFFVRRDVAYT
ncbi:ABC transporter permease [Alicyclobacillus sp. SO9]|uniref:ABC transporter permease n=1 Tax=Alicyclobacillus sp. SO9 TaxID=2665646 RepID=UPI0018E7CD7F|nr:ABC transporter permease [Alicyclobacillus sp. SO9]QQE78861.1 ABC transporter permease [Alicyclobacillus sp. SO9]